MTAPHAFSIRVAGPADAEAITALLSASYSILLNARYDRPTLDPALPFMTRANPALLRSGTYYVAAGEAGDLAGCGGWTMGRPGTGEIVAGEAHIRHFATHPARLKRGVGAALMAHCIAEARQSGVHTLHCFSTLNAVDFYRASGFEVVGPIEVTMAPGLRLPSMLLRRAL